MTRQARPPRSYCRLAVAALEVFALAIGLLLVTARPAAAQMVCGERDLVVERLAKKYGEVPVAVAITDKGGLVEVLTSDGGDTWTIIVTTPDSTSCLVAAGEGWRPSPRREQEPEA